MEFIWIVIGGFILYAIITAIVKAPGQSLAGRFQSLGNMTGKTKDEIIAVVGPPNSSSAMADGGQLLQWLQAGYHIAIAFDANGIFVGIQHEFSA